MLYVARSVVTVESIVVNELNGAIRIGGRLDSELSNGQAEDSLFEGVPVV